MTELPPGFVLRNAPSFNENEVPPGFVLRDAAKPNVSMVESGLRGYGQGATLGKSDEAQGLIGAAYAKYAPKWLGGNPELFKDTSFMDAYREGRGIARGKESAAREANPWTYGISEVAGGVATIPAGKAYQPLNQATRMGRMGNAALVGGQIGAGAGLGYSEADLTKGEIGRAAGDVLQGGIIGGLTGGALQGVLEAPGALLAAKDKAGSQYAKTFLNWGDDGLKKSSGGEFAKEGAALEKRMGIKFSEAERTGSERASVAEDWLANRGQTADRVATAQKAKIDRITQNFEKTLSSISKEPTGALTTGNNVQTAFNKATESVIAARRGIAERDFKLVDQLSGGQRFIRPQKFVETLQGFIKEADSPLASPAQKAAAREANSILENMITQQGEVRAIRPRDLQNALHTWGEASSKTGNIWKNIQYAGDKRFARSAFNALLGDMDDAIQAGGVRPDAVQALKTARDNYRQFSTYLDKMENTVLGKYLGEAKTPEDVSRLLRNMEPSEITQSMSILDKHAPEVANNARRYLLEQAMGVAKEGKGQRAAGLEESFSLANFTKSLPDDAKLNAILGNSKAAQEIRDIASALNRMEKFGGWKRGSQTAMRADMERVAGAEFSLSDLAKPGWYFRMAAQRITPDKFADILLNDGARSSMLRELRSVDKVARKGVVGGIQALQQTKIPTGQLNTILNEEIGSVPRRLITRDVVKNFDYSEAKQLFEKSGWKVHEALSDADHGASKYLIATPPNGGFSQKIRFSDHGTGFERMKTEWHVKNSTEALDIAKKLIAEKDSFNTKLVKAASNPQLKEEWLSLKRKAHRLSVSKYTERYNALMDKYKIDNDLRGTRALADALSLENR